MKSILKAAALGLSILFGTGPAFGQRGFSLSVSALPFYTHSSVERTIYFPDYSGQGDPIATRFNSRGTGGGFSIGLMGRYAFSPHWSASTGLWLNYGWSGMSTITTTPSTSFETGASRSRNFQVPLLINYLTSTRRLAPYFSVGAVLTVSGVNYLRISSTQEVAFTPDKQSVKLTPILGAGISYRLSDHLSLIAQPTFQYTIPPSDVVYAHTYQAGLLTQLLYSF